MAKKPKNNFKRDFINRDEIKVAKSIFNEAIDFGLDFKSSKKVINYRKQDFLKKIILEPIPLRYKSLDKVISEFKNKIGKYSINFSSERFLAFPDSGNAVASVTGAIMADFLNQNLINSKHCSPVATFAEVTVINWLREIIGYQTIKNPQSIFDVGGIITSGGVMSNTVGILLAREKMFPNTKENGIKFNIGKIKVAVPDYINHYSIKAALGLLGLGENNLLKLKSKNFKIDLDDLRQKVKKHKKDYTILALVAYAGDSRTMTIDDFIGIHKIIKDTGIWFHIDACHGFQYAFSEKLRPQIAGIELADSITMDPHKVLFIPYTLSVILVKEQNNFKLISGSSDLITNEEYSFGQITPMLGSKNFSSLKLWFLIKNLGKNRIGELIEARHDLAGYLADKIRQSDDFVLINKQVAINSVVFMFVPPEWRNQIKGNKKLLEKLNILNKGLQDLMFMEGDYYVHTFVIPDLEDVFDCDGAMLNPLRHMGGNPLTTRNDIDGLLGYIRHLYKSKKKYFNIRD